jgi:acyl-CoA thioesterase-1
MNPVVVQIANGNAFFIGIGMTVLAFALRLWLSGRFEVILLTALWLIGISLVILSATPLPLGYYFCWFGLCIWARLAFSKQSSPKSKVLVVVSFAIVSLAVCLVELPFHLAKQIPVSKGQTIYVIGDSISAGIELKEKTWPSALSDLSHLKVVNLARPGATLETAVNQIPGVASTNSLVILEMGGNDLLGSTDSHTFYLQLDTLLRKLKSKDSQIVMFELPLLPFWNAYGRDQRILANEYHVILIPKKILVQVFGTKGDTLDGLHLSQKGHDELAKSVSALLKISQ